MNPSEFIAAIAATLDCDPSEVAPGAVLKELPNWDSLAVLSVVALAQEKFGRTISGQQVAACATVTDLAALVGLSMGG